MSADLSFGRVLKELADLDDPMRTPVGSQPGQGAMLVEGGPAGETGPGPSAGPPGAGREPASIVELAGTAPVPSELTDHAPTQARPEAGRSRSRPTLLPDPSPDGVRSRFDPDQDIVYYNDQHPDYLMLKSDEQSLLDYLATLVAKEYVVYNNPRAASDELAEEMVRMLVRVRRHLPREGVAAGTSRILDHHHIDSDASTSR